MAEWWTAIQTTNSYGDIVYPTSNSTGGASDNAIDLGYNNGRWKDLYLGGGAYIGGRLILDDYEEGTFKVLRLRQNGKHCCYKHWSIY